MVHARGREIILQEDDLLAENECIVGILERFLIRFESRASRIIWGIVHVDNAWNEEISIGRYVERALELGKVLELDI
jgi:hypothetical protein